MTEITKKQKEYLDYIINYIEKKNHAPSVRDVANHFGVSIRSAYDKMVVLRMKGFLEWDTYKRRTVRVIGRAS